MLTIAGSECSGGAGIQADIKTITVHKAYAMSVITALTAQNTLGVRAIQEATPQFVAQQMEAVFEDITPDAVKIGMTFNSPIIMTIALNLRRYQARNIVLDPVMMHEAGCLCGRDLHTEEDMVWAAEKISEMTPGAVLIKGGHLAGDTASDLLYCQGQSFWFKSQRVNNSNSHGTGCTLSSAIACQLAQGAPPAKAVYKAKQFLLRALKANLDIGHGRGPLNHCCDL